MLVTKRDGRKEEFNRGKIIKTCLRAGVSREIADKIVIEVERRLYDGITTDEILKIVIDLLDRYAYRYSARYDLKASLLRLGPTGYGFEKFTAGLLKKYGYKTTTNQIIDGRCVTHEVDVIAEKHGRRYLIECKFHNIPVYTGLKDVMYTYARFLDVSEKDGFDSVEFDSVWIFTNTKFSSDAKKFAECRQIKLTGWRYPENEGIESLLEAKNLYPVTVLRLDRETLMEIINYGFVFCKDLIENENVLKKIAGKKSEKILSEAKEILKLKNI